MCMEIEIVAQKMFRETNRNELCNFMLTNSALKIKRMFIFRCVHGTISTCKSPEKYSFSPHYEIEHFKVGKRMSSHYLRRPTIFCMPAMKK